MKALRSTGFILLWLAAASSAQAWGRLGEVGTSAAVWLTQAPSARLLAMGGAGTADLGGVSAWWWNPAAPAAASAFNAELSVRRHLADTSLGFVSFSLPTAWGTPSLGLTTLKTENIAGYDAAGQETGTFALQDGALKFGWAWAFDRWHLGAAAAVVNQDFGSVRSTGTSWDLGALWEAAPGCALGLSGLRFGRTGEGDPFPAEIRLGGSARLAPGVAAAVDLASPRDAEAYLAAGLEWAPVAPVALRLGWRTGPAASWQLGTLAYFSAGAGFAWNGFALDYAFEPAGGLGNAHHLSLAYRFPTPKPPEVKPAPPTPAPTPEPVLAPRLKILPRSYEGRMVFTPRQAAQDFKAKSVSFKVKDAEGRIVRTFSYAGAAVPKELVWDGKDNQGRLVDQDKAYTFAFEYQTASGGVKSETLDWPQVSPARKLFFKAGGLGIAPEVYFRFQGETARIRSWRLTLVDRADRRPVRVLTGKDALPAEVVWDGRNESGVWVPPNRTYAYQLELISQEYAQAVIEHPVVAIPAEVTIRKPGRVRFKILQILFDFAQATIRAEMADKIEMAAELSRRGAVLDKITGHADELGTHSANLLISQRRAEAVKAFLGKLGHAGQDASVEGFGNDRPVLRGDNEEARSQNRRVEIILETDEPAAAPPAKK